MAEKEDIWVTIQRKTFARWVDNIVKTKGMSCSDNLEEELKDGVILHTLLTATTGQVLPKITNPPKVTIQKMENVSKVIKWMTQNQGIKLVALGAEDIYGGKTKYCLGLIWTLILYFQLGCTEEEEELGFNMRSILLEWCNNVLSTQGITVRNFRDNWADGRAFCGLVNALHPNTIPLSECTSETAVQNLKRAFDSANALFEFPKMLEPEEVVQFQDELSIITYVSYFRAYLSKYALSIGDTKVSFKSKAHAGLAGAIVQLVDERKNNRLTGGDKITATCKPLTSRPVRAHDKGDGTYTVTYPPDCKGKYSVSVLIDGRQAPGGPWEVLVKEVEVRQEAKTQLAKHLPRSANIIGRLLIKTTEKERADLIAELGALKNK